MEPAPPALEGGVLTTGPPGKSPDHVTLKQSHPGLAPPHSCVVLITTKIIPEYVCVCVCAHIYVLLKFAYCLSLH